MDEFSGFLDFGFLAQRKPAPMPASKVPAAAVIPNFVHGSSSSTTATSSPWNKSTSSSPPSFDSIFEGFRDSSAAPRPASEADKPIYDDDSIFAGISGGVKSSPSPSSVKYEDFFGSIPSASDDFLENLGRAMPERNGGIDERSGGRREEDFSEFDDLIPGFGGSSPQKRRPPEAEQQSTAPSTRPTNSIPEDPFVVLKSSSPPYSSSELFTDPLEDTGRPNPGSTKTDASPVHGGSFDANSFDELTKPVPLFTSEVQDNLKDKLTENEQYKKSSTENTKSSDSLKSPSTSGLQNSDRIVDPYERNGMDDRAPDTRGHLETADNAWLTVDEIPLFTQPTSAPPPSRPPPPTVSIKQTQHGPMDEFSPVSINTKRKDNEYFPHFRQNYPHSVSPIDGLENFTMSRPQQDANEHPEVIINDMNEAMDRAGVKFKHAREVWERERDSKTSRGREPAQQERDEKAISDEKRVRLDHEREQVEREEREREQILREQEREQELKRERQEGRQAVDRATREAQGRAAAEARVRAERAVVDKVNAETRQRAERAAMQRATTEARERAERAAAERAVTETRERLEREKAAAEALERAETEDLLRTQRAAVDRANAEARRRAAAKAQEKAVEKQRTTVPDSIPSKRVPDEARPTATGSIRKTPSPTPSIVDDLSSIFGAPPSSGGFQEVNGESEERRRTRLERHQRTNERAVKAVEEKNKRDFQVQRDQEERDRIAETLDIEIKRWALGKEGNLRALLSTLQYVLWPECGWQPVSLIDLITGASVKKVYRKATLCIHPDKVQQKGATIQQKYIAEKVFDLLKEAWNKFNSEELY